MTKRKPLGMGMKELLLLTERKEDRAENKPKKADRMKKTARAEKQFGTEDSTTLFNDGVRLLKQGELLPALKKMLVVNYLDPKNLKARNNAGVILFELGLFEEAEAEFRSVLEIDPADATARENLEEIRMAGEKE